MTGEITNDDRELIARLRRRAEWLAKPNRPAPHDSTLNAQQMSRIAELAAMGANCDDRVTELIEANNRQIERRRAAQARALPTPQAYPLELIEQMPEGWYLVSLCQAQIEHIMADLKALRPARAVLSLCAPWRCDGHNAWQCFGLNWLYSGRFLLGTLIAGPLPLLPHPEAVSFPDARPGTAPSSSTTWAPGAST